MNEITCRTWHHDHYIDDHHHGPLYCLLYRMFMHQSMFSPRGERPGIQYPRYLTQCLLLWLGNRKRFDKTQNPKGRDIWQSCKRAWKLQSSTPPPPTPPPLAQCWAKCFNTDGMEWKCPFCVIEDLTYKGEKVYFMAMYVCICMYC